MARHLGADVSVDVGILDVRSAVVAALGSTSSATRPIDRVDVAATGPTSPIPPGIPHLPGPGQYYASPALTTAHGLDTAEPARRAGFPGTRSAPSARRHFRLRTSLIIVIGHDARQLSQAPAAVEVRSIQQTPSNCYSLPERSRERSRPAMDPGRWGAVALLAARAHLDRDSEPPLRRQARGALRRHAARRRHAAPDLGDLSGGSDVAAARGSGSRLRPLLSVPAARSTTSPSRDNPPRPATSRSTGSTCCSS